MHGNTKEWTAAKLDRPSVESDEGRPAPADITTSIVLKKKGLAMQNADWSIQTMAARCGMTEHTLRYYERVGLIQPVRREQNGHRRYSDQDENWLNLLKSMRAAQMPIRELRRYAALRAAGDNRADAQRKILERHRAALESRIADLQHAHALLAQKIDALPRLCEREVDTASEAVSQPAG